MVCRRTSLRFAVCLLAVMAARAVEVQLSVGAHSCTVLALDSKHLTDGPMRVAAGAFAGSADGTAAAFCTPSHIRVRGLESSELPKAAACSNPTVLEPGAAGASSLAASSAGLLAGAAYFTIESSCQQAAVLTLDFGGSSSGSDGSSSGMAARSRKLLQNGMPASNATAPRTLRPPHSAPEASNDMAAAPDDAANSALASAVPLPAPMQQQVADKGNGSGSSNGALAAQQQQEQQQGQEQREATYLEDGSTSADFSGGVSKADPTNATSSDTVACCCLAIPTVLPYMPEQYRGSDCCCGTFKDCCGGGGSSEKAHSSCNSLKCGATLLVIGIAMFLVLVAAVAGGIHWRRQRRQRAEAELVRQAGPAAAHNMPRAPEDAECDRIIALPPAKQKEHMVHPAHESEVAATECAICLENVTERGDSWSLYPCGHYSCNQCIADLVRHNRHRRAEHKCLVHCPMCRRMALVPRSCLAQDGLPAVQIAADAEPAGVAVSNNMASQPPLGIGSVEL